MQLRIVKVSLMIGVTNCVASALGNYFSAKLRIEDLLQNTLIKEGNSVRVFAIQLVVMTRHINVTDDSIDCNGC